MTKKMLYHMTGIVEGWKIIREELTAASPKEAKEKLRRMYKRRGKAQWIKIWGVENV